MLNEGTIGSEDLELIKHAETAEEALQIIKEL